MTSGEVNKLWMRGLCLASFLIVAGCMGSGSGSDPDQGPDVIVDPGDSDDDPVVDDGDDDDDPIDVIADIVTDVVTTSVSVTTATMTSGI